MTDINHIKENAIAWARSHEGKAEYVGCCLSFIEDAVEVNNGVELFGGDSAKEIGDGQVIHAWNRVRVDDYLELQQLTPAPEWSVPVYIGWVPLERVLAQTP